MRYRLVLRLQQALLLEARAAIPNEACGFAFGSSVEGVIEFSSYCLSVNISAKPQEEFLIDGSHFRTAYARAESAKLALAIWHSHPHSRPIPSKEDFRLIEQLEVVPCIIVGVRYPIVTIYECENGRVREALRINVFNQTIVKAFHACT